MPLPHSIDLVFLVRGEMERGSLFLLLSPTLFSEDHDILRHGVWLDNQGVLVSGHVGVRPVQYVGRDVLGFSHQKEAVRLSDRLSRWSELAKNQLEVLDKYRRAALVGPLHG